MFDFAWSEFALIGVVGLLFIGPKDMPVAIKTVTNLLKKGRKLAGEFQSHVDEMVRDVDLGEARDQLRQLRSFNVRGQIMKALDEDGSLKRTFDQKPLGAVGSTLAPGSLPADGHAGSLPIQDVTARPVVGLADADVEEDPADHRAGEVSDPAPVIVPPATARRLRIERARALPPSFVPPRPVHPGAVQPRSFGQRTMGGIQLPTDLQATDKQLGLGAV